MPLSQNELDQRVAILRRFRELLLEQREKFHNYLTLLDHQQKAIETDNVDALVQHVEAEQAIVADIFALQKVIDPLEDMYRAAYQGAEPEWMPELKTTINSLKTEVISRNEANRKLLKQHMEMLRHEIMSINNPYTKKKSIYADTPEPRALDIKG